MLWVNKDVDAEQVPIESPDLTAAVIRLPERLIFMASVYVEHGDAQALRDTCNHLRKAITKMRQNTGTVVEVMIVGAPFQQYKHFHGQIVNQYALLGSSTFDKCDFLYELKGFRTRALTQRTNRKGFSERGIHPFNPDLITSKLRDKYGSDDEDVLQIYDRNEAPSPDISSSPTNASFSPPDTAYSLQKSIKGIEKKLQNISEESSSIRRGLTKIFRGSLSQAHIRHQHKSHINRLITHHEPNNRPRSRRQVKSGGVLSIKDANGIIDARKKAEMDAAWKKAHREAKRKATTKSAPEQQPEAQDGWVFDPPLANLYEREIQEYRALRVISFDENVQF
jgi:hypothetical protein